MSDKTVRFHAHCNLRNDIPELKMSLAGIADARAAGYDRVFREVFGERRDPQTGKRGRWVWLIPACDGFETTDPAAFDAHMEQRHGRRATATRSWTTRNGMWNGPRLTQDGRPITDKRNETQTCPDCGLVAEVDDRAANVLWWDEHLRGCAIAHAESGAA